MVGRRRALHAIIPFGLQTQSNDVRRGMPSSPLGSTYGRTTSSVACHHRLWAAHIIERHRAWHAIIAIGQQTPSNDVQCVMPSSPLESTNGRTTSGVACHHSPWTANTANDVRHGMPSSLLGCTNGRTTSGVACHHSPWMANTDERRQA